jgi:probable phosphoglycerate mutase
MNGYGEEPLTALGEEQAASLKAPLSTITWDKIFCSPRQRVRRTAELAGYTTPEIVQELHEFDCGDYEGLTSKEIQAKRPGWEFWRDGCAGGETIETASTRIDGILNLLRKETGATLVFSHAGTIRILVARYLGLSGHMGSGFGFDPAHLGVIATRSGHPAIMIWNDGNHLPESAKEAKGKIAIPH